jgi:hypothetical protein
MLDVGWKKKTLDVEAVLRRVLGKESDVQVIGLNVEGSGKY